MENEHPTRTKENYLLAGAVIALLLAGYVAWRIQTRSAMEAEARRFHCRTCQCEKFSIKDPNLPLVQWSCIDCKHSAAEHGVK